MQEEQERPADGGAAGGEGTAAVLYGMFTSFTESLDGLEARLVAIDTALQRGPGDLHVRLEAIDERMRRLEAAVESLRALLQAHADDTAHSLGRRASDAGRRLASDLGLLGRRTEAGGDR